MKWTDVLHSTFDAVTLSSLSGLLRREKWENITILFIEYQPACRYNRCKWSYMTSTKVNYSTDIKPPFTCFDKKNMFAEFFTPFRIFGPPLQPRVCEDVSVRMAHPASALFLHSFCCMWHYPPGFSNIFCFHVPLYLYKPSRAADEKHHPLNMTLPPLQVSGIKYPQDGSKVIMASFRKHDPWTADNIANKVLWIKKKVLHLLCWLLQLFLYPEGFV